MQGDQTGRDTTNVLVVDSPNFLNIKAPRLGGKLKITGSLEGEKNMMTESSHHSFPANHRCAGTRDTVPRVSNFSN